MSSLPHSDNVLVAPVNNRTMCLPIQLQGIKKTIDTTALIDLGATGNFIDPCLLSLGIFKLSWISSSIIAYNIDGTPNNKRTICWMTVISFTSGSFTDTIKFMVIQLSCPQIILSMPWLQKWNPKIDWRTFTINFRSEDLPIIPDSQGVKRTLCERPPLNKSRHEQVDKLTISTKIAQAEKPKEATILKFCADFTDVFSEKTYEQLPPYCPFDCTIDLKDTFVPKITKVYLLNPAEKDACKTFIKEYLKTGHIVPSKSPQATPFFFVPKKNGTLCPCQDYQYLNSHTI